jgi:hypothetical protein
MVLAVTVPAWAGPIQQYNAVYDVMYGAYRKALFDTNTGKPEAALQSLRQFLAQWDALVRKYGGTPPPQYAEDTGWAESLADVTARSRDALAMATSGRLPEAHEALEAVRDAFSSLRRRNGIVNYSDHMNVFHKHMEHILKTYAKPLDAEAVGMLREDAAVLRMLAVELKEHAPRTYAGQAEFQTSLGQLRAIVDRLLTEARAARADGARESLKDLKPAYAKLFVRWG